MKLWFQAFKLNKDGDQGEKLQSCKFQDWGVSAWS